MFTKQENVKKSIITAMPYSEKEKEKTANYFNVSK